MNADVPQHKSRGLLIPALMTLVALAVLVSLGLWQLERRDWKAEIIARIEARTSAAPVPVPPEAEWPAWSAEAGEYRRVTATGTFLHQHETPIHGIAPGDGPGRPLSGYYLLTPLQLASGAIIMVDRGFVPEPLRNPAARPGSQPAGEGTITGLLRAPETPNRFSPANDPARGEFYVRDPAAIAAARGLTRVAPFSIAVDADPSAGQWPRGGLTRLDIPDNHLQYALTWFGLAGTLLAVFAVYAFKRLRQTS